MDQVTTLQHLEYLESGFEVSKRLTQAGYRMDAPALVITWGQVAEAIARTLADYGIPPDRLDGELYREMVQNVQQALGEDEGPGWRDLVRLSVTSTPGILSLLEPLDIQDDEGPLTEVYENATRIGDDEGYWADGGASADLFDGF
jgi:hypothetical protein